ncbi:MAG: M67 family metallopeptidase [Anaerolineales bacterium]
MTLVLTQTQWHIVTEQLTRELPNEACGLLAGVGGVVQHVYPIENIRRSPVAYEMQPEQQIRTMDEIEARGWEITAIYHSHPAGPSVPSPTDIAEAYYPESLYLICSADARGAWVGRAFRIENGTVTEVPVEIVE